MMTELKLYNVLELIAVSHLPDPGYLYFCICCVSIDSFIYLAQVVEEERVM